ncbi:flagellar filament capping protein FliD [Paenibacillus polymyxa]|uniref:flagellar filament capping protein FliD n=1 Tax=Paenibacillus polymyxa TaxID=1406 RepID=UPI0023786390|nr:flagellar filament capping protein FliD [Paenibacillus polymyxa]WDM21636.1 flagellar filament capping protein FliD [Paenibacillus polymyxa]
MRINGFSGMDIDNMVTNLMTAKKAPLNKLNQQKQILEWTRDSYRELNSKIVDFRTKLSEFNLSPAMNTQQAVVSGNTTAIKADASAKASGAAMAVHVTSLAQKSIMTSGSKLSTSSSADAALTTKIGDLSTSTGAADYTVTINGKSLTFSSDKTIANVINTISTDADMKVNASFDEVSGKFSITSKDYGTNLTDGSGTLKTLLGMGTIQNATAGTVKISTDGGSSFKEFTTNNNSLTVNGVTLTLLSTNTSTDLANIQTRTDPAKALDTIKNFVQNYNDLLNTFGSKVKEEKYRDYQPLTDEQKKDMKENDITLWEQKAKSGLLKNDNILSTAVSSMRSVITGSLDDLSAIGITTGQYYENGKIYINEEKLKVALQSDPQKVMNIFQGSADGATSGIYNKISDEMNGTLDLLAKKAGTSKYSSDVNSILKTESIMGKQLADYKKRISDMKSRLSDMETRYYKQFSAMEEAMNKYQSQSSSLTSFLQ